MSRPNTPKLGSNRGSLTPKVSSPIDSILRISQNASVFVESVNPLSNSQYKKIEEDDTDQVEDTTVSIPLDEQPVRVQSSPQQRQLSPQQRQFSPQQRQFTPQQQVPQTQYNQNNEVFITPQQQFITVDPLLESLDRRTLLYLAIFQGGGSFVVNFGLNFLIAWAMYNNAPGNIVSFASGLTSIIADVAVTAFVIPFATAIIGTLLVKNDLRSGKLVKPVDKRWLDQIYFRYIPHDQRWRWLIPRALVIGIYFFLLFFPLTILIVYLAHTDGSMAAEWDYIAFKGYWGGLEGALCMPIIAFIPMATKDVKSMTLPVHLPTPGPMAV
eukprot:TRINITY_DN438_c0_g1_i1.p1 TRINITY_DN438_c0_g1~~TRINITY_DN438_c0_g1_i1.p1  ORF type:complete len:326 (-),score=52.95 TRINITY_DN438_c0_g1_i1:112-1089(-)